jgi:dihydrofolate reductase
LILAHIAALSKDRVIGTEGRLPWHLPEDLKRFRALTRGKPILLGRKTFESIGRLLPERAHFIVSR